jgi:GntR family transcriptional regulator
MPRRPVKAEQIAQALAQRIASGEFGSAGWLPPLRELARTYDVVERTVMAALRLLAERGGVDLVAGRGARVSPMVQRDAADITRQVGQWRGFHVAAGRSGAEAFTDTYRIADVAAAPEVAGRLGIPIGTTVLERARVQGILVAAERCPVQLSTTWVVADAVVRVPVLREHDTGPGGMGSRLAEAGYVIGYEDVVTARMPTEPEREQLGMVTQQPVVIAWRRAFDQSGDGRAIEVTRRIINPALHELVYRYG